MACGSRKESRTRKRQDTLYCVYTFGKRGMQCAAPWKSKTSEYSNTSCSSTDWQTRTVGGIQITYLYDKQHDARVLFPNIRTPHELVRIPCDMCLVLAGGDTEKHLLGSGFTPGRLGTRVSQWLRSVWLLETKPSGQRMCLSRSCTRVLLES